ncbi:MAG TPA: hypothetical protein VFV19_00375 [Candidatus Polarisedimenticolaceae bacterium]|nr:hypothetical protein [Candidatus Polarisedimenticolaceae bacterium]
MSGVVLPALILRWCHIVPAVVAGGATVYTFLALIPALGELPAAEAARLREAVVRRWRVVFMVCVTLLLASGLLNFLLYQSPAHRGQALYHGIFGIKFLAALVVFFLGSALTGRSAALAQIRANARFWTGVSAALVILIVLLSGILRGIPAAN